MVSARFFRSYQGPKGGQNRRSNPYFRSRTADRLPTSRFQATTARFSPRLWFIVFALLVLVGGLIWLTIFSSVCVIKEVVVTGTTSTKAQAIEELVWRQTTDHRLLVLPQSRLLIFNRQQLKDRISNDYIVETIRIKKKWLHRLVIEITEKNPVLSWYENDRYYILDKEGWMLDSLSAPWPDIPVVYNNNAPSIVAKRLGTEEQNLIAPAIQLSNLLTGQFSYLKPKQVTIPAERDTLVLMLEGSQLIYFNSRSEIIPQLERLDTLLKTELKNRLPSIDYIDLRFGDKVYYK